MAGQIGGYVAPGAGAAGTGGGGGGGSPATASGTTPGSGTVFQTALASGAAERYVATVISGYNPLTALITEENISGVRAVAISQSGNLRVAMASLSGRMPAIGVAVDNALSGIQLNVYQFGNFQTTSGLADYSGYIGYGLLFVGRSGQVVTQSGSFNSGGLLSGDISQPLGIAISSGSFALGAAASLPFVGGLILSGQIGSGQIGNFHIASGQVQGLAGAGVPNIGSGTFTGFELGSGAIVSGRVASGQIGSFHVASGQLTGFELGSGAIVSGRIASGQIGNFHIASGQIQGLAGAGVPNIASGTFTGFELGSGAIVSGRIASGQVGHGHHSSGSIQGQAGDGSLQVASGTLSTYDFGSGAVVRSANFSSPFHSGTGWTAITQETISGIRAVAISQSGNLRIAMASISGRMPAIGFVIDNILSGIQANVYTIGCFQATSGLADYSGYLGRSVFVGRSGQVVTISGSFNSGGLNLASGADFVQRLGTVYNSGGFVANINPEMVINIGTVLATDAFIDSAALGWGL